MADPVDQERLAATLIEATGLSEWSTFIERCPQFADNAIAKRLFMCGFASGASWASTLEFESTQRGSE